MEIMKESLNVYIRFLEYMFKALIIVSIYKSVSSIGLVFVDVVTYSIVVSLILTLLDYTNKEYTTLVLNTVLITTVGAVYTKMTK